MHSGFLKLVAATSLVVGAATIADAHHAFSAEFDGQQPVLLQGVVTKIYWTNPHSWLFVDVKNKDGSTTPWSIEFGAPYALLQKGLRKTDFPTGVEVTVKGFRAKSGKPVANAASVTLADGRGFYTGANDAPGGGGGGGGD
jgi:hypothetical protein